MRLPDVIVLLVTILLLAYAVAKTFGWLKSPEFIEQIPTYLTGLGFLGFYYLFKSEVRKMIEEHAESIQKV